MRMIDQEKVITALEQVKDEINPVSGSRKARLRDAVDDAIALLKEQEAVRPDYEPTTLSWSCGNCGQPFDRCKYKYCPNCGREVKWE